MASHWQYKYDYGGGEPLSVDLTDGKDKPNHGKSITLKGSGTLTLNNHIDQGAGGLFLKAIMKLKALLIVPLGKERAFLLLMEKQ